MDARNIGTEWGLFVPEDMHLAGFKEEIIDEDNYTYEGEIWFIGELK
jgi:hypothetical protein